MDHCWFPSKSGKRPELGKLSDEPRASPAGPVRWGPSYTKTQMVTK
jgi:hypothetical protein